jgi:NTE family protein
MCVKLSIIVRKTGMLAGVLSVLVTSILSALPSDAQQANRPKVALALGGGGTRGAAHVGVLRVLQQQGIQIDYIAGTSMGSVVGALYAAGLCIDDIESKFTTPKIMKNFMTVSLPTRMALVPVFTIPRILGWHPYDGFYFGNKYRKYLESCFPQNCRRIQDTKIPFRAVCTDLVTGQLRYLDEGPIGYALQASCAVPILRKPVPTADGALLCDGAMVQNLPVDQARAMGADIVIAVDVDERLCHLDRDTFRKSGSVALRVEQIYLSRADASQVAKADIVIHPNVDGIDLLSTKASDAREAIRAGEAAARAALPHIFKKLNIDTQTTVDAGNSVNSL